jgi:hypothetical protein
MNSAMYFMIERDLSAVHLTGTAPCTFRYQQRSVIVSIENGVPWSAQTDRNVRPFCRGITGRNLSPELSQLFNDAMSGKPSDKASEWVQVHTDSDGRIVEESFIVPGGLPAKLEDFCADMNSFLNDYARRTVEVLRWRLGASADANPFKNSHGLLCSIDGRLWRKVPTKLYIAHEIRIPLTPTNEIAREVEVLVENGASEPIWHAIWREAWQQCRRNLRGAIVLAICAAEVAVKHQAVAFVPDVEWLLENVQSPPVIKLLKRYLPRLYQNHNARRAVLPPNDILRIIDEGVQERNRIVHHGKLTYDFTATDRLLKAISDLLWILDFNTGSEWAISHARQKTRESVVSAVNGGGEGNVQN